MSGDLFEYFKQVNRDQLANGEGRVEAVGIIKDNEVFPSRSIGNYIKSGEIGSFKDSEHNIISEN
jgi:hypothetical protein